MTKKKYFKLFRTFRRNEKVLAVSFAALAVLAGTLFSGPTRAQHAPKVALAGAAFLTSGTDSISGTISPPASGNGATVGLSGAAPVQVQSAPGSSLTGNSSGTVSFSTPSVAGDTIVLFVRFGGTTISGVTDNHPGGSNIYTSVLGPTQWGVAPNSTDRSAQVFVASNIAGGSTLTITVNLAGNSTHDIYMAALEYSGVDPTNPVNVTAVGSGTNGHAPSTGNATTTVANTKLVATSWDSNESYTASGNGTGYVTDVAVGITSISGGSGWSNLTEDRTAAIAGTWNATASSAPAVNDWIVQMVALTPANFETVVGDANGNYAFTGLANGTYSVTPVKGGSTFSPPSQTVTINGNVSGINFTDTAARFSISGNVSQPSGGNGATLTLTGAAPVLAQSAAGSSPSGGNSGTISFNGPNAAGNTIVLFVRFGGTSISKVTDNRPGGSNTYTSVLGPTSWGVAPNSTDRWAQVFVATNASGGSALIITVTLAGSSTHNTYMAALEYSGVNTSKPVNAAAVGTGTVAANGAPVTGNLTTTVSNTKLVATSWDSNESYTSSGSGVGYLTDTAAGAISIGGGSGWANLTEDQTAFAAGTWNATASSSPAVDDWAVQLIALAPMAPETATVDSSGNYSFGGLANGSYTITPSEAGFTFTPASLGIAVKSADVNNADFTATGQTYSISGTISPASSGSGATVTLTGTAGATTTADSSGNYIFNGVTNGGYTVTPTKSGVTFNPASVPATVNGANVTNVNFTVPQLSSIAVTPANPSLTKGKTQQFTATGTFSDGSTQNLTSTATWSSSTLTVATISTAGLATSVGTGSTTIQASSGSINGSTTLTVTPATLVSISVTPANPSIAKGKTQQFTATGTFSDGTTQNLTSTATWSSSAVTIATINTAGLATAAGTGSTTIQASSGGVNGSTTLTVTPATLVSIAVTPANPTVSKGGTQQFAATGTLSDGTTQDLTSTATWSSSSVTVATINTAGLATAGGTGSTTIQAASAGITGNTTLTVTAATLVSMAVTPANPSVPKGGTQQFTATGTFSDGTTQNLTSTATWSSSAVTVATINAAGLATAVTIGSTTIQAASGSISGSTTMSVTAATLASIAVTPANLSIAKGKTQQFTATGTFSDGTTQNLTSTATWSSSAGTVATISTAGLSTAVGTGSTTIRATSGSISGSTTLTVTAATLVSVAVTPANPSVAKGKTQQFTATGTFSDGTTQNLTSTATWSSSAVTVATINTAGLATTTGTGSTTIQASSGSVSGSTTLTVTPATLASIAVTPAKPSIAIGKTEQFTATGTFSDGTTQNLTSIATWNSSSITVATINSTGLATAVGNGSTSIQAVSGTISGSTTLSVASGVPVLVRSAGGSSSAGNQNGTVSFSSTSSAGDTIVLFLRFGGTTVSRITDNQAGGSNIYSSVIGPTQWGVAPNVTDRWAQVFVAKNIKGGSKLSITVNLSGSSTHNIYMAAVEYSGVDPVNPVNATASRIGTVGSNGAPATGNLTTTVANSKLVATSWDSNDSYTSASNGAGYATNSAAGVPSISGGTGWGNLTEDRTAAAPGAWNATTTSTRAVIDWVIQLVALKPAVQ
jgi:Bacterial Ig-like domain (group 2)